MTEADNLNTIFQKLVTLREHECWEPYEEFASKIGTVEPEIMASVHIDLARTFAYFHINKDKLMTAVVDWLKLHKGIHYDQFHQAFLLNVVKPGDFLTESKILERAILEIDSTSSQVQILERLCYLYEKKLFHEKNLAASYSRLLELDSMNLKALKYLKMAYSQAGDWQEVAVVLEKLVSRSKNHPQSLSRYGQELASVYLYERDSPKKALATIESHCKISHLDVSTLKFDSYERLGEWSSCLEVLDSLLSKTTEENERASLYYKSGSILEGLGRRQLALTSYLEALKIAQNAPLVLEKIIRLYLQENDFSRIAEYLSKLLSVDLSQEAKSDIMQLQSRMNTVKEARV